MTRIGWAPARRTAALPSVSHPHSHTPVQKSSLTTNTDPAHTATLKLTATNSQTINFAKVYPTTPSAPLSLAGIDHTCTFIAHTRMGTHRHTWATYTWTLMYRHGCTDGQQECMHRHIVVLRAPGVHTLTHACTHGCTYVHTHSPMMGGSSPSSALR